jgi:hypothetical protein
LRLPCPTPAGIHLAQGASHIDTVERPPVPSMQPLLRFA